MRIPSLLTAAAAAVAAISSSSANATIRLANDPGGLIAAYEHRFVHARATGERIVIDGACLSACTLAAGLVPRDQICVTPKAVMGFHAAWTPTPWGRKVVSHPATDHMYSIYYPEIKSWIDAHGGLKKQMIFLKGPELEAMVPACSEADVAAARAPATHVAHTGGHRSRHMMIARGRRFHPYYYARPMMMMPRPMRPY